MRSRFGNGLKILCAALAAIYLFSSKAQAQDELGEQIELELRQLRAEVDFLRDQLETGGGVADVRFEDLQRRIDTVLDDAAALASQASTAQRRAEAAVRKVDVLEDRIDVLENGIDTLATRLARLEEDAVFAEASTQTSEAEAPAETSETAAQPTAESPAILDDDGVLVPLPKDRTKIEAPAREISQEVTVADENATVVPVPADPSPDLIPVADTAPIDGELPVFPGARPEAPARSISPALVEEAAPAAAKEPAAPVIASGTTPATAPGNSTFSQAKFQFVAGEFDKSAASLQVLVDGGTLAEDAAEAHFLLGTSYLNLGRNTDAIQALAQGLRQYPASDFGGPSLVNLADALQANEQMGEACRLLSFVAIEYPLATQAIADANKRTTQFGC